MALVRILVNGYGLLRCWPALAPGKPRESEVAREELINHLTQFFDATGTQITVVFDGPGTREDPDSDLSTAEVEVRHARAGQTADQYLERLAHKAWADGEILLVSDHLAASKAPPGLKGSVSTCEAFVQSVNTTLADLKQEIQKINQQEKQKFTYHG